MEARVGVIQSGGTGSVGADGAEGDWFCRRGSTKLVGLIRTDRGDERYDVFPSVMLFHTT
jgi:hypothetical protein